MCGDQKRFTPYIMNIILYCVSTDLHRATHQCKYNSSTQISFPRIISPHKSSCYIFPFQTTDIININITKYITDNWLTTSALFNQPPLPYQSPVRKCYCGLFLILTFFF